ncbi:SRPBCC family protein [Saccharopolyspora sp. NPDC002686]|uniref:SRPBCC family protein n=1 Tax=Saccharopolyspora sp. NPDC002686 TaxID=3154541 RepID=UPI003320C3D2
MATLRAHALIDAAPDAVWEVVGDSTGISRWFPAITSSTGDAERRTVVLEGGVRLHEEVVTADPRLRRFQYRITGGDLEVAHHLGTVDVIDVGGGRSLVVYSTDVEPAELAEQFGPAIEDAVGNLASVIG